MNEEFQSAFNALKPVFGKALKRLTVKTDTASEYTVVTRKPSPFPQHKGNPMYFGSIRLGKAYVSFHLVPIYMCDVLAKEVSPALRKKMQGKACFNFKTAPGPELLSDLRRLTDASQKLWMEKTWM